MSRAGETPLEAVHMTGPQPHTLEGSVWPLVAAVGLVLLAVGLTISMVLAAIGVLVLLGSAWGAAREVNPPGGAAEAGPLVVRSDDPDFWRRRPKQFWLGAGMSISSATLLAAVYRAWAAHGLFHPGEWPDAAPTLHSPLTLAATLAIGASLVCAFLGTRAFRQGTRRPALLWLAGSLALGAAFLAALMLDWARVVATGFGPTHGPAGSGYVVLMGYHALTVGGGLMMLGVLTWHAFGERLGARRNSVFTGMLVYWTFAAAAWLLTYVVVHLRLVVWGGRFLI